MFLISMKLWTKFFRKGPKILKAGNSTNHNAKSTAIMSTTTSTRSLRDFGYAFNADGQLRKINENGEPGDQPFQFNICDNHQKCQQHYEAIGESITEHVYNLVEQEGLIKLSVPEGAAEGSFIFVSKDYHKRDDLLVLIHGSGVVRAGQWARSLIINDSVHSGTQIPYIRRGMSRAFGILIMNTNDNTRNCKKINGSGTPEEHAASVWESYISQSSASSVSIIAHSYGGVITLFLANKFKDFEKRVKAVALTDSVHNYSSYKVTKYLKQISRNWVSSTEPLDSPVKTLDSDIERVSAGHPKHEMTSHSCIESVFAFIQDKLK